MKVLHPLSREKTVSSEKQNKTKQKLRAILTFYRTETLPNGTLVGSSPHRTKGRYVLAPFRSLVQRYSKEDRMNYLLISAKILLHIVLAWGSSTKNGSVILINDDISTVTDEKYCMQDSYFLFHDELYKICIQHLIKNDIEISIYVQKEVKNSWETQEELISDVNTKKPFSLHTYIDDNEIVIIMCKCVNDLSIDRNECYRWDSTNGNFFKKEDITIPDSAFNKRRMTSYTLYPLTISTKKILLLCGINIDPYVPQKKEEFIYCIGSENRGKTWMRKVQIIYEGFQPNGIYYHLTPHIFNDELGFHFYSLVGANNTGVGGEYIVCKPEKGMLYRMKCENANLGKEGKSLQDLTKMNGYYIASYVNKEKSNECYLYYTSENAIILNPKKQGYLMNGCYSGFFVKINESSTLFIYAPDYGTYNIHTIKYMRYD
ncbi:cysteine-rich protective antigen, putative [Plasmodium ovale curtisi]|uniref:Cysteine-rich protective antigen, putative n=1 Tax=Plasmodium ovale curtisi TaxID=864141 RepID=A0A1A8X579_PLAOA|nr:cysteine-rich protective antigen, putative [Plasmodium ovale curtisi]